MGKIAAASTLVYLLFLILAGICIIIITVAVVLLATPLQGAVIVQNLALPGDPDFSNEEDWADLVVQSQAPRRDVRKWLVRVLLWAIAGLVIFVVLGIQYNMRQRARTKRQHYMLNRTSMASEERARCAAEEAWSAPGSEQDKSD